VRTYLGLLSRALSLLEQRVEQTILETGLSASELVVMQVVLEEKEVSTSTLLTRTGLRASTLSSLLTRLERLGYVRRTRGGPDRRSRLITVTLPGDRAVRIATSLLVEIEQRLGAAQDRVDDLETLHRIGREISRLAPPAIDPADGLPIATA
jgi:DNA-binding MarR family transcriptional regulator